MLLNKKFFKYLIFTLVVFVFSFSATKTSAFDTSAGAFLNNHNYNEVISDDSFIATNSMGVDDIQRFLITKNSYLKDYQEGGRSAAQIIYDAANARTTDSQSPSGWMPNGIPEINESTGTVNPRVILVMLEKEQSLVSRSTRNDSALNWAMGYGCPDGGGCNSKYAGFAKQVDWGAWQLRFNYYRAQGYGFSEYQVGRIITIEDYTGDYQVTINNRATSAIYRYTPHVFDSAYNFWKFYLTMFQPQLDLTVSPGSSVTLNVNGLVSHYQGGNTYHLQYAEDVNIALTPDISPAAEFQSWSGCTSVVNTQCNITMRDGKHVIAQFAQSLLPAAKLTTARNSWDSNKAKKVTTGDFNGDGKKDIAVMYDYGLENMSMFVFLGDANGGFSSQQQWYNSGRNNWSTDTTKEIVAGDYNSDGKDDIAVMYNYGRDNMSIFVFSSNGSNFSAPQQWYNSGWNNWSTDASRKVVSGDFNDDGKEDIGVMYNYGRNNMSIFVFPGTGSSFSAPQQWYNSGWNNWGVSQSKEVVSGDFNGDEVDDIGVMYDYGRDNMNIFVFLSNGNGFNSPVSWYNSGWNNWNASMSREVVSGDFNGDGKKDIAVMYDYQSENMSMFVFPGNNSSFGAPQQWYNSGWNSWGIDRTKDLVVSDNNSDSKDEITSMYDYGSGIMSLIGFNPTGKAFTR